MKYGWGERRGGWVGKGKKGGREGARKIGRVEWTRNVGHEDSEKEGKE
jgi:hypothetical protein